MTEPRRGPEPAPSREREPAAPRTVQVDLSIARDGTWYHEGTPIARPALVKLFAKALRRDAEGRFWIVTPAERAEVRVADAPFVAVDVEAQDDGRDRRLEFRTNVDDRVVADAEHPIRVAFAGPRAEPAPYVRVRDGLEALIARPVYYRLVDLGVEAVRDGRPVLGVWSAGVFFPLGELSGDA
ncbi:MAG: DUF1285 domain-containing protein [Alphaproteobacteria bacterium]